MLPNRIGGPGLSWRACWAAACLAGIATACHAQDFLRFDQVPFVSATEPERFAELFEAARSQTVRALLLGDSQETSPGGFGYVYVPRLNYEFYRVYGNAPASPLSSANASTGGGAPWSDWLIRSSAPSPGFGPGRLAPNQIPPNLQGGATSTAGGNNINNNQFFGALSMLQPGAEDVTPEAGLAGTTYFDSSAGVYLDIFAATNASSGEVRCVVSNAPTSTTSFFEPTRLTLDTTMGLRSPVFGYRTQRLGPFSVEPGKYLQTILSGTDPNALTDVLAVSFSSVARPEGWVVSSISMGGYQTRDFLGGHAPSIPLLGLYNPDVVLIHFGANDGGRGRTPAQFKADLETLLASLRSTIRADLPVIVFTDPYAVLTPETRENFDRYAGVAYAISLEDPLTCAVNSRRLSDEVGWNQSTSTRFLVDGIHYTAIGAKVLAALEVRALASAFGQPCALPEIAVQPDASEVCPESVASFSVVAGAPDLTSFEWQRVSPQGAVRTLVDGPFGDGSGALVRGAGSPTLFISEVDGVAGEFTFRCRLFDQCGESFTRGVSLVVRSEDDGRCQPNYCDPDVNRDGNTDAGDLDYLVNAIAGGDNPAGIDLDFNLDGNADSTDADALLNVIAGGECP